MGAAYARPMAASAGYRGTIALPDAVIPAPISATALAIMCWDDSLAMHGIQSLPTPPRIASSPPWRSCPRAH